ncbi:MAG TPA: hypothetical protein VHV30_06660 [Polyangiaceae bacterium]|nr:hypothetical protein [Polyangiaceae bacterium]
MSACLCTAACGPSSWTNAYTGTATIQTDWGSPPAFEKQSVEFMSCAPPVQDDADQPPSETPAFAVLTVGDQCEIDGAWSDDTFVAQTGGSCVLPFTDKNVTVRVTDAVVRRPVHHSRFGSHMDESSIEVSVGGDTLPAKGTPEHVLYAFKGTIGSSIEATEACLEAYERHKAAEAS